MSDSDFAHQGAPHMTVGCPEPFPWRRALRRLALFRIMIPRLHVKCGGRVAQMGPAPTALKGRNSLAQGNTLGHMANVATLAQGVALG